MLELILSILIVVFFIFGFLLGAVSRRRALEDAFKTGAAQCLYSLAQQFPEVEQAVKTGSLLQASMDQTQQNDTTNQPGEKASFGFDLTPKQ